MSKLKNILKAAKRSRNGKAKAPRNALAKVRKEPAAPVDVLNKIMNPEPVVEVVLEDKELTDLVPKSLLERRDDQIKELSASVDKQAEQLTKQAELIDRQAQQIADMIDSKAVENGLKQSLAGACRSIDKQAEVINEQSGQLKMLSDRCGYMAKEIETLATAKPPDRTQELLTAVLALLAKPSRTDDLIAATLALMTKMSQPTVETKIAEKLPGGDWKMTTTRTKE